jgi:hypothetical protein
MHEKPSIPILGIRQTRLIMFSLIPNGASQSFELKVFISRIFLFLTFVAFVTFCLKDLFP